MVQFHTVFNVHYLQIPKSLCYTKNEESVSWKNAGSEEESTNINKKEKKK